MKNIFIDGNNKFYINDNNERVNITTPDGKNLWYSDVFVDISYGSINSVSSSLSNLFHYDFVFHGIKAKSIEGILQGIKYKNRKMQKMVFQYQGKDAYHTRAASFTKENDWRINGCLYFKRKKIDRFGIEYQMFLNKLYLALLKNPIFVNALAGTGNRELIHSIGVVDPHETILTPKEYILRLEYIRSYLLNKEKISFLKKQLNILAEVITKELQHIKGMN